MPRRGRENNRKVSGDDGHNNSEIVGMNMEDELGLGICLGHTEADRQSVFLLVARSDISTENFHSGVDLDQMVSLVSARSSHGDGLCCPQANRPLLVVQRTTHMGESRSWELHLI